MPMMIDKYDAKRDKKSLHQISKLRKKTKLDGSFQRYGGYDRGSGWDLMRGISYLVNLVLGATFNTIINVDVGEALKYAKEQGNTESVRYFSALASAGYDFLSVDGNNSSGYITALVEDEEDILIPGPDGVPQRFSNFSEEDQEVLKYNEKVEVITLRRISISEVCDLFRHLNTSTQLNPQEWRQARWSDLSAFVRNASNGLNRSLFKNLIFAKDLDLDKRFHEEMVAQLALKTFRKYESYIDKIRLDSFYETTITLPPQTQTKVGNILSEVRHMALTSGPLKKRLTKGKLHNLFDVVEILTVQQGFKILEYKKFFEWFLKKDGEFTLESSAVTEAEKQEKSYVYWTVTYGNSMWYKKTRQLFESALAQDIDELINNQIIRAPTKNSYFSWKQKVELMRTQGYKTRKGKDMSYLQLYLGEYEADHMKSQRDGGETTIENGELMSKLENRKKGAHSNEPYFPHQK